MRRIPAVAALAVGIVIIISLVALSGFSKASDGQNLIDDAANSASETGIVRLRSDVDALNDASTAVVDQVFPAFARELGLSDTEFEQRLRASHPQAASAFLDQRGAIFGSIDKTVSNLEAHQDDYDAADGIPTSWIPLGLMPWFGLGLGLALIGLGAWAWVRPGFASSLAIAVVGVLMVSATLITSLPSKAHKAAAWCS